MNVNRIMRLLLRFGPQLIAKFGRRGNARGQGNAQQSGQKPRNLMRNARMMQRLMRMFRL